MSKTKEYYMSRNMPPFDIEREYLFNDILAQEQEYLEYEKLKKDPETNIINSKIEIGNDRTNQKKSTHGDEAKRAEA